MIVIVEEAVFTSPRTTNADLVGVFGFGLEGRHRVQVDPVFRAEGRGPVHDWIKVQSPELQDEISLALDAGIEEEVRGIPADHTVRIADIRAPEWDAEPPRLPLGTGMKLLRQLPPGRTSTKVGAFRRFNFRAARSRVPEAHAISKEALAALERRDWARFIEARRKTLDDIEREFVTGLGLEYVVE